MRAAWMAVVVAMVACNDLEFGPEPSTHEDDPTSGSTTGPPPAGECLVCGECHSHAVGDQCTCDEGYEWASPELWDLECVLSDPPPEPVCPDPNSVLIEGLCYCNDGYEWCSLADTDLTCCRLPTSPATTGETSSTGTAGGASSTSTDGDSSSS
jgi:hypothetical protein